jgi:hypothetical protein
MKELSRRHKAKLEQVKWSTVKDLAGNASDLGDAFHSYHEAFEHGDTIYWKYRTYDCVKHNRTSILFSGIGRAVGMLKALLMGTSEWQDGLRGVQAFGYIWAIVVPMATGFGHIVKSMVEFIQKSRNDKDIFSFIGGY